MTEMQVSNFASSSL